MTEAPLPPPLPAEALAVEVARTFRAVVGEPAVFPLYSSTYSTAKAGDVVDVGELERLPSISTVLQPMREVPVRLEATVSEIGTVELALRMTPEALERFRLSFSTRLDGVVEASAAAKFMPAGLRLPNSTSSLSDFTPLADEATSTSGERASVVSGVKSAKVS